MLSVKLFVICLVLVAGVSAAPGGKRSKEDIEAENRRPAPTDHVDFSGKTPVVVAHVKDADGKDHEFRVPLFDPNEELLPMEAKLFAENMITQVVKAGKEIVDAAIIKNRSSFLLTPQIGAIGVKFMFMAVSFAKKSKALKKKYNRASDAEFEQKSIMLLPALVSRAREEMKNANKEDAKKYEDKRARKETGKRIMLILDGVKQLVFNSPVGTHLLYEEMTVDGKLMTDEAVEHLKFMSKTGLGWIIDLIEGQCGKILAEKKRIREEATSSDEE